MNYHFKRQCGSFLIKLNMYIPYDPAISLLGINLKEIETVSHKNLYIDIFSSFLHYSRF